jgi:hypothetical protein
MYYYYSFQMALFSLVCVLAFSSCHKLIEVPSPQDQENASIIFSDAADATTAVLGIYISIMDNSRSLLNGGMTIYGGLSSDELSRTSAFANEDAFTLNALSDQNPLCNNLYIAGYNWIYDCNNALEKLSAASGIDDSTKRQLSGEVRFTRALIYFYLVNLYGGVPLVITTDYKTTSILPRTSSVLVYQQITDDLKMAQDLLSDQYMTTLSFANDRTRPNRAAATALLARVYLYQGYWALAQEQASTVIGNTTYQLETDLDKVFLSSSQEAIWQLQPVHASISTAEGSMFIPYQGSSMQPAYALTAELLNSFEPGDQRLRHWTAGLTDGSRYVYPFKYKLVTDIPANAEYNTVLRLSEQYLIRAEARARQGDTSGASADLNIIRRRAGLPVAAVTDQTGLLAAIWHERQIEFFAEWGHRWLDLKRTGQIDNVLGIEKPGWKAQADLYPFPFSELAYNPYLVQNPGY